MTTPTPTAQDALDLEQEGKLLEAIDVLSELNRRTPRPAWERRLVRMRHEAFSLLPRSPREPWPPDCADPFPDGHGDVPEVTPAELSSDLLGGALVHHGCLLVRGLLDPDTAGLLRDDIDQAFTAFDEVVGGSWTPAEGEPWYAPFRVSPQHPEYPSIGFYRRKWVREGGGVLTADSPRSLAHLTQVFQDRGLDDVIAGYLGEHPALAFDKCTLRRVPLDLTGTDWHQDGSFLGQGIRTVNVWLALTDCGPGTGALGMDMVPRRVDHVLPTGTEGATFDWSIGPALVDAAAGGHPIRSPRFSAGDALLFDDLFVHRTSEPSRLEHERYAIETWFFAPSAYPDTQIPLAW